MALAMLTGRCWANLARTVHGFQPVPERDVVLLGARELDAGERVPLDGSEIALLAPEQARTQLAPVLAKLSGREGYVHVDLDSLDPAEGRANGLAVPGGFTVDEACAALEQIGHSLRVRAVALTAYDPVCDPEGRICRAASRLLGAILGTIAQPAAQQSLAGDGPPPHFDEMCSLTTPVTAYPAIVSRSNRDTVGEPNSTLQRRPIFQDPCMADVVVDALFRHAGVIRTRTLEELFDVASLLAHQPVPRGRRVAILTNAGGPGILAADACASNGLEVPASDTVAPVRMNRLVMLPIHATRKRRCPSFYPFKPSPSLQQIRRRP
jgi:hypothetical protein